MKTVPSYLLSKRIVVRSIALAMLILSSGQASVTLSSWAESGLDVLVNQGNAAANRQDYASAIKFYEQAVQKAPQEGILKKNLAVLYANQAVALQEQKQYAQALKLLDQAESLVSKTAPEAKSIRDTRASVLFAQAMDFKESKESLTAEDYTHLRALLNQAMALSPNEAAFKKGMASTYLDEAYQLALAENYENAASLLETGLSYDSNNKALKQSLANVYLGLARNQPEQRNQWIEKALAQDNSPKIQAIAEQLKAQSGKIPAGKPGFAKQPGEVIGKAPPEISQLSVAEMITILENQLQLTPGKQETLTQRLEVVEKQILGKPQTGALAVRAKNAYVSLMGSYQGTLSDSNLQLSQAPVTPSENSYLDEIFKVTDGKVVRWGRFPLRVYFQEPENLALYKPEYKQAALAGFSMWKSQTDDFIKFVEIKNPQAADIIVNWQEVYQDRFADPDKVPDVYKHYTPPKNGKLISLVQMASMFTPGYFYLAPQAAAAALQYQQYKKLSVIVEESKIHLGLAPIQGLAPEAAKTLIQNMAAKEFGHALGLKACSSKQEDLLYPELRSDVTKPPSSRDLQTLRELYNRPPNIILNVH